MVRLGPVPVCHLGDIRPRISHSSGSRRGLRRPVGIRIPPRRRYGPNGGPQASRTGANVPRWRGRGVLWSQCPAVRKATGSARRARYANEPGPAPIATWWQNHRSGWPRCHWPVDLLGHTSLTCRGRAQQTPSEVSTETTVRRGAGESRSDHAGSLSRLSLGRLNVPCHRGTADDYSRPERCWYKVL
jgi:hypothetical protein